MKPNHEEALSLVVGGEHGLGFQVALELAQAPHPLHVLGRNALDLARLVECAPPLASLVTHKIDLARALSCERLLAWLDSLRAPMRQLVLVAPPGEAQPARPCASETGTVWAPGHLLIVRFVARGMARTGGGSIVAVGPVASLHRTAPGALASPPQWLSELAHALDADLLDRRVPLHAVVLEAALDGPFANEATQASWRLAARSVAELLQPASAERGELLHAVRGLERWVRPWRINAPTPTPARG